MSHAITSTEMGCGWSLDNWLCSVDRLGFDLTRALQFIEKQHVCIKTRIQLIALFK